jgi:hypothetical protein
VKNINKKLLKEVAQESRGLPEIFLKKNVPLIFVHSYPNLDRVLMGMDVITRAASVGFHKDGAIVLHTKSLKEGTHVFIGLPRLKGVAKAFVERIDGDLAYITGMGEELEGVK